MQKIIIFGLRRSGTSMLRNIIAKAVPGQMLFEPHDLYNAILLQRFPRYKDIEFYQKIIDDFENNDKIAGCKFAINPGIDALKWIHVADRLKKHKLIFIARDIVDTWKSYSQLDKDTLEGICDETAYKISAIDLIRHFLNYCIVKNLVLDYDSILQNKDYLNKLWKYLDIEPNYNWKDEICKNGYKGYPNFVKKD